MQIIPIFFTFDNNYTVPAAVALFSMLNKAKDNIFYKIHILHSDISKNNQQLIKNSISGFKNFEILFQNTNGFLKEAWGTGNFENQNKGAKFTADTLLRCFPAKFFPQYDKIIYSDVDIVFKEDISEIYSTNLDDKYIAAVKDAFMKWDANELSHMKPEHYTKFKDTYFAGGIWVLNLEKIRKDNLEEKMIEIINDDTIIKRWNDMDVMNLACDNKVKFLPLNYIAYPYLLERVVQKDFVSHFSREELFDSIINPKIIHYAGIKPWKDRSISYAEDWWTIFEYLKLPKTSIFSNETKVWESDKLKKKIKKYKKLIKVLTTIIALLILVLLTCSFKIFI